MIDPWKFNPLTDLGNKARKSSEIPYTQEALLLMPKIIYEVKRIKKEVRIGKRNLIDYSNELFL